MIAIKLNFFYLYSWQAEKHRLVHSRHKSRICGLWTHNTGQ